MTSDSKWTQQDRTVAECLECLRSSDDKRLPRRAERLAKLTHVTTFVDYYMPRWTSRMLDEACDCFTERLYFGCILALAAGIEYGLRTLFVDEKQGGLNHFLKLGKSAGYIHGDEYVALDAVRVYRNSAIHGNIPALAAGKRLFYENQPSGSDETAPEPEWEEVKCLRPHEQEAVVDLDAEEEIGELLINARLALYAIFDRYYPDGDHT